MRDETRGPRVHRPAASATWEYEHHWGPQLTDRTRLAVTRTDGGGLRIAHGRDVIELRGELVERLAEMVAAAAVWTDTPTRHDTPPAPGEDDVA